MTEARLAHVVGFGMGPHHLTREAVRALEGADVVIAFSKGTDDPLLSVRRAIAAEFDLRMIEIPDPERDRDSPADYGAAVRDWHEARAAALADVLAQDPGVPAFLVWGDPSLYDSTLRLLARASQRQPLTWQVSPGISAPQLLAARHGIVLHEVGAPVHVTTARGLATAIDEGQRTIVVMLGGEVTLPGLDEWHIWWGANLGAPSERLVRGRVADVRAALGAARQQAKQEAGWVMDTYLLRAPTGGAS